MNEFKPQLITPEQAAELVRIDREQVYCLMADNKVSYVEAIGNEGVEYKLPLQGFINCTIEFLDLGEDLEALSSAADSIDSSIDVLGNLYRER